MIICNDCKKEMRCEHTGTRVRYGAFGDHVYAGDTFKCPTCGKQTTVCNANPYQDNIVILAPTDIIMDEITDTSKIKKRTINLRRTEENGRTDNDGKGSTPTPPNNFRGDDEQWKYMQEIVQKIATKGWFVGNSPDDRPFKG